MEVSIFLCHSRNIIQENRSERIPATLQECNTEMNNGSERIPATLHESNTEMNNRSEQIPATLQECNAEKKLEVSGFLPHFRNVLHKINKQQK